MKNAAILVRCLSINLLQLKESMLAKLDAQLLDGNNKEKHFSCNFCDRSFKYKRNLKDHLRTHTGERRYQCDVGHKSFIQNGNFQTHMRTHTGERTYKCDVCDKLFSVSSSLKTHMRTHTGERPYQCNLCHKSFSDSRNLKTHENPHRYLKKTTRQGFFSSVSHHDKVK
ncbi:uncharacterized protein LOC143450588 [Clavelina lepadiformis]|uniref:uncharacterized protein LOC143450588 n=1 Tax=Clavelina lepadiformis TaxID=159417 RepID=UPI004040EE3A